MRSLMRSDLRRRGATAVVLAVALALAVAAMALAGLGYFDRAQPTTQFTLHTVNDSGVTGTVTLTSVGSHRTSVRVEVDPAGHASMPAHIHPGTCADPVPQPKYPLQNVIEGQSTTEIPVSLDQLLADKPVSVNLHKSNDEMRISTACVDLL